MSTRLLLVACLTLGSACSWQGWSPVSAPKIDEQDTERDEDDPEQRDDAELEDSAPPIPEGPLVLYLAPEGDDANDGSTPERALYTFDGAQARLIEGDVRREVEIRVAPGTYYCRELAEAWSFRNGNTISILSAESIPAPARDSDDDPARPIFEGRNEKDENCEGSVWFTAQHGDEPLRLRFEGLKVTRYRGALSVKGEDPEDAATDQQIEVRNMVFERIGDKYHYREHLDGSWLEGKGAVLLTNTSGSLFVDNYFRHVRNQEASAGLIHAMYFTSHAQRHRVEGNTFSGCTGVIVKLTDFSNGNSFLDNQFSYGDLALRDRWCGALEDPVTRCDGEAQCPSWENSFPYERNAWSNLDGDEPVRVLDIPEGQTCDHEPPESGVRMDLGEGGMVRG